MPSIEPLVFLSCGGTIEKIYRADSGKMDFDQSRIADWAKQCRIAQPWRAQTVMLIDSLEMTDGDRETLAKAVAATPETKIVVLHGTDTMVESAKVVMLHRKPEQVVVFTGAMVPASLEQSDAMFNFGLATAAVQLLHPGVYIAMSGQVFEADRVHKNRQAGVFEAIDSSSKENTGRPAHLSEGDEGAVMQAILKEKIGLDIAPQTILGACNPQFASKALSLEPSIGLLLPCNVVVRQTEDQRTVVEFLNPQMMVDVTENSDLAQMANEVSGRLEAVIGAMSMAAA